MEATKRSTRKSRLRCKDCDQPFTDNNDLIHHICSYSGGSKYNCLECGEKFMSKSSLTRHASTHKKVETESECDCTDCGEKFASKSILTKHMSDHNKVEAGNSLAKYASTRGKERTNSSLTNEKESTGTESSLARHSSTRKENNSEFSCADCESVFRTKRALTAHSKIHKKKTQSQKLSDNDDKLPVLYIKDTKCGKVFKNDDSHVLTDIKCEKLCKNEESLSRSLPNWSEAVKESLECPQCHDVFGSQQSLRKHAATHTQQETSYQCMECGDIFHLEHFLVNHSHKHITKKESKCHEGNLVSHSRAHINERTEGGFKCQKCNKENTNFKPFYYHSQSHSLARNRFYKCQVCAKVYTRKHFLAVHAKTHSNQIQKLNQGQARDSLVSEKIQCAQDLQSKLCSKNKDLQCLECNKVFASKVTLSRHIQSHSGKTYMCHECGLKFAYRSGLTKHMHLHTGQKKYECAYCSRRFLQKDTLKRHIALIHTSGREHKCQICGRIFARKNHLTRHMPAHQAKTYDCEICQKQFNRKSHLIRHMQSHKAGKPYQCEQCGKQFRVKESLTLHHNSVHLGLNAFECSLCSKGYYKKRDLKKHILNYHQGQKLYECDICGKKLNGSLRDHKLTHAGVKSFHCKECNKSFMFKRNLKRHMENHLKVSNIQCEHCDEVFTSEDMYSRHKQLHMEVNSLEDNEQVCVSNNSQSVCSQPLLPQGVGRISKRVEKGKRGDRRRTHNSSPTKSKHTSIQKHNSLHDKDNISLPNNGDQNNEQVCMFDAGEDYETANGMETGIPVDDHSQRIPLELLCQFCGQIFSRENSLKLHLKTHTEKVSSAQEEEHQTKDYYCSRNFVEDDRGVRHVDCSACGHHFAMEPNLAGHIIIHTAVKSNLFEAYRQQYSDTDIHTKKSKYSESEKGRDGRAPVTDHNYIKSNPGKGADDECVKLVVDGDAVKGEEDCVELMVLDEDAFQSESCLECEVTTECSTREVYERVDSERVLCEHKTSSEGAFIHHKSGRMKVEKVVNEQQIGKEETFTSVYQDSRQKKVANLKIGECLNLTVVNGEVTTDKGNWPKHKLSLRDNIMTAKLAQNWPKRKVPARDNLTKIELKQSWPKCKARDDTAPAELTQGYLCEECGEHFTKECNLTAHLITCKDASEYRGDEGVRLLSQVCEGLETWNVLPEDHQKGLVEGDENGRLKKDSECVEDRVTKDEDNPNIEVEMTGDDGNVKVEITKDTCRKSIEVGMNRDKESIGIGLTINKESVEVENRPDMTTEKENLLFDARECEVEEVKKENIEKSVLEGDYYNKRKKTQEHEKVRRENESLNIMVKRENGIELVYEQALKNESEVGTKNGNLCKKIKMENVEDEESVENEGLIPVTVYLLEDKESAENERLKDVHMIRSPQETIIKREIKSEVQLKYGMNLENSGAIQSGSKVPVKSKGKIKVEMKEASEQLYDGINMKISTKKQLKEKPIKQLRCELCHKCFAFPSQLAQHSLCHTKDKAFSCEICQRTFSRKVYLTEHLKKHKVDLFQCEFCGKTFAQKSLLDDHAASTHNLTSLTCPECGKPFTQKGSLKTHLLTHKGIKRFICEYCGDQFSQKGNMKRHLLTHGICSLGDKMHVCPFCDQVFAFQVDLNKHMFNHEGNKPHQCHHCAKSFLEYRDLKRHEVVHTGEKNYECPVCQKRFTQEGDLRQHLMIHTGDKKHKCDICQREFTHRQTLNTHKLRHTDEKRFACEICQKRFRQKISLVRHLVTHQSQREKLTCNVCGRSYSWDFDLIKHRREKHQL